MEGRQEWFTGRVVVGFFLELLYGDGWGWFMGTVGIGFGGTVGIVFGETVGIGFGGDSWHWLMRWGLVNKGALELVYGDCWGWFTGVVVVVRVGPQ